MRPAGRSALDSLYFDYPRFAAPATRAEGERHPVVIVGAGPVGLLAALALARNGVASLVVEMKNTFNDGSRAICIQRQSFHILERLGAIEPFQAKALGWTMGRSFYRGRPILEFEMPHDGDQKFLPMYNLQQQYIEQYLFEAARRTGLVDVRWQTEATAIETGPGSVALTLRDPAGSYRLEAEWLLAADGARSPIRAQLGLRLAGDNFEGRYAIADIRASIDYPTIRRAFFDPLSNPGRTVLVHRQPDDLWRIDYQLDVNETTEAALDETTVRRNIEAILGEIGHRGGYELEWWSVYAANTLALDDYRAGRTFFIGDSAHIVPIFGVRGLNNGLADAENIAWKLARVLKREAGPELLASYSAERRDATKDIFRNAGKSTRFMTPPSDGWRLVRDAALSLALEHDFVRELANPRQMTPHAYGASPLAGPDATGFEGGPAPGVPIPNAAMADGEFLSDRLAQGFTALLFAPEIDAATLERSLQALDPLAGVVTLQNEPAAAARFAAAPGDVYLVRPDMYVARRWRRPAAAMIVDELTHILRQGEAR